MTNHLLRHTWTILFFGMSIVLNAQHFDLRLGAQAATGPNFAPMNYLGEYQDHHYVLSGSGQDFAYHRALGWQSKGINQHVIIQKLDQDFNPVSEGPVELDWGGARLNPEYVQLDQDQLILFFTFSDPVTDSIWVYKQIRSMDNWQAGLDWEKVAGFSYKGRRPYIRFVTDREDRLAYFYLLQRPLLRTATILSVAKVDAQANVLWTDQQTLSTKRRWTQLTDHTVDAKGNLLLLHGHDTRKPGDGTSGRNLHAFSLLKWAADSKELTYHGLPSEAVSVSDLQMEWTPSKSLLFAGFYGERMGRRDGTYFTEMNPSNMSVALPTRSPFEIDHIVDGLFTDTAERVRKRAAKGRPVGMSQLSARDLVVRPDGGCYLTAEIYYEEEDEENEECEEVEILFVHGNISTFSLSPSGQLEWSAKVKKRQVTTDGSTYSSFATMFDGSQLHFLYNDHERNINPSPALFPRNFSVSNRTGLAVIATISSQGAVTYSPLAAYSDLPTIALPRLCVQTGENEMLFFGKRGAYSQYGKVIVP